MRHNIRTFINRLREKLWFRPFIICLISIVGALIAHLADGTLLVEIVPEISTDSLSALLDTISASMLVISIFSVASMLSAFSAASSTATPRSFKLVIADDVSQNALSAFIGAFIFSIVATVALKNGYFGKAGNFVLFIITLIIFAIVILTFLRWVDRISRLGRLGHTIKKVEEAATKAIKARVKSPLLNGVFIQPESANGSPIYSHSIGYIQHINVETLQNIAESFDTHITLNALQGNFIRPNSPIAFVALKESEAIGEIISEIDNAFTIGDSRLFDDDPRFGFITLSEIASRALSPGINDPGTAIQVIGSLIRLFYHWSEPIDHDKTESGKYDRIAVPEILIWDLFEDAFRPIARDGAGNIEVMLHLQKAFRSIEAINHPEVKKAARFHSQQAFKRAELEIKFKDDLETLKKAGLLH